MVGEDIDGKVKGGGLKGRLLMMDIIRLNCDSAISKVMIWGTLCTTVFGR